MGSSEFQIGIGSTSVELWEGGGGTRKATVCLFVLCAYAPIAKVPPGVKERFYAQLQDAIEKVPLRDNMLIVVGDFNARVGVLDNSNQVCGEVYLADMG